MKRTGKEFQLMESGQNFAHGELRCGYLGLEEGLLGGHRTKFCDLPSKTILGHSNAHVHRVYAPKITVTDPRIRKKYNKKLLASMRQEGTLEKVKRIREIVRTMGDKAEARQLHKEICANRKRSGEQAVKGLRKRHTGAYPYSPAVAKPNSAKETVVPSDEIPQETQNGLPTNPTPDEAMPSERCVPNHTGRRPQETKGSKTIFAQEQGRNN